MTANHANRIMQFHASSAVHRDIRFLETTLKFHYYQV